MFGSNLTRPTRQYQWRTGILVVEDESVIRSALKRLLERHKFRVFEAASVKEAEEHFQLDRFCRSSATCACRALRAPN